jgi:hypothetical protein
LDGGKKPSVELRVSRFDQAGEVTPVRLGPGVLDQKNNSRPGSHYNERGRRERGCPACLPLNHKHD